MNECYLASSFLRSAEFIYRTLHKCHQLLTSSHMSCPFDQMSSMCPNTPFQSIPTIVSIRLILIISIQNSISYSGCSLLSQYCCVLLWKVMFCSNSKRICLVSTDYRTFTTPTVGITVNTVSTVPLISHRNGISSEDGVGQAIWLFILILILSSPVDESVAKVGQPVSVADTSNWSRQGLLRRAARAGQGTVAQRDEQGQIRSQPRPASEGNIRK